MPFATLAAYKTALKNPYERVPANPSTYNPGFVAPSNNAGQMYDNWVNQAGGTSPTAYINLDRTSAGGIGQRNGGTGKLTIVGAELRSNASGTWILIDRLVHGRLLVAGPAGEQAITTPSLTRYTSGVGVYMGLTVYSPTGGSSFQATATYTNQASTSGRVASRTFGGTHYGVTANRFLQWPLVAGDTGVKSIQSFNPQGTTGATGAQGFCLYRPLMGFVFSRDINRPQEFNLINGGMVGGLPEILDDACLSWLFITGHQAAVTTPVSLYGYLYTAEYT